MIYLILLSYFDFNYTYILSKFYIKLSIIIFYRLLKDRLRKNNSKVSPAPIDIFDQPRISRVKPPKEKRFKDISLKVELDDLDFFPRSNNRSQKTDEINKLNSVDDLNDIQNVEIYSEEDLDQQKGND